MTYSALFSASFLCSNVKFMTFVYSVSALEVLLVYTALYKLSFIIIIIIIIIAGRVGLLDYSFLYT